MAGWELKIIEAEAQRLIIQAAEDADLRADLRALANQILEATETPRPDSNPTEHSLANAASAASEANQADPLQEPEPLHELTLGQPRPRSAEPQHPTGVEAKETDLGEIEARCRIKAEAARLSAACLRQFRGETLTNKVELASEDPVVAPWAQRFTDSFYWLDARENTPPPEIHLLDNLGGCFETLAGAMALAQGLSKEHPGPRGRPENVLPLLAEAQSMLRRALERLQAPEDPDQVAAYEWVRQTAARHRIYLKNHLRADELADPDAWPDLLQRIEAVRPQARKHQRLLDRLRVHLETLQEVGGTDQHWREVVNKFEEMVDEGLSPSSKDLRNLLLPVIEDLPLLDDLPDGFQAVLREIDRFQTSQIISRESTITPLPTEEVREASRLLNGRKVVLIGGNCRPDTQEALRKALGLAELIWIETKEHQAVSSFEPTIARPEVALVLLAIRWSSHAFGEVRHSCERLGKPLVRLPGGYGANQVAAQIVAQCGDRLRES